MSTGRGRIAASSASSSDFATTIRSAGGTWLPICRQIALRVPGYSMPAAKSWIEAAFSTRMH